MKRLCEDRAISIAELETELEQLGEDIIIAGDGTEVCMRSMTYEKLLPAPENVRMQSAWGVAMAALDGGEELYTDAGKLQPIYLRVPQAERELKKRQ